MVEITKEFLFEAAHHLPPVGPDHKCFRLHGHLFRVEVTVAGEVDPAMGWVMDFGDLARVGREVVGRLDHRVLNEIPEIGVPTSENIARYLYREVAARVPGVTAVTVHESPSSRCTFRPGASRGPSGPPVPDLVLVDAGGGDDGWGGPASAIVLSAAHFLLLPPDGREPIHGHDYRAGVSARVAPGRADEAGRVLGACLARAVADLDHRLLLPGHPVIGTLTLVGDAVTLDLPGERLVLPARDCAILPCGNTSTEAIARVVADRLAAMDEVLACGAATLDVRLTEAPASTACVRTDLVPT